MIYILLIANMIKIVYLKYENVLIREVNYFIDISNAKNQLNTADSKISDLVDNTKDAIQKVVFS